jgi:hypothetical protein
MSDRYATSDTTAAERQAVLEPGTAKTIGFVLGLVAIFWVVVKFFRFGIDEEDRPPIRVRNPDIDFTTGPGWVAEDPHWKPNHKKGKRTDYFVVDIQSPTGHAPMIATGVVFHCDVTHGQRKITLSAKNINHSKEPRLHPSGQLKLDSTSQGKRLFVKEGSRLEKIVIENKGKEDVPIDLSGSTGNIYIEICPERSDK